MLEDIGVVVLNYITHEETKEMIDSLKHHYPEVRTVIVDNGSPDYVVEKLHEYSRLYDNVSVLPLKENLGFAKGNNAGIKLLREEGYKYICCSNSDIVIPEKGVLESLKAHLIDNEAAIAGPRVIGGRGREQNPLRINRPNPAQAKKHLRKHYLYNVIITKRVVKVTKKVKKFIKIKIKKLLINLFPKFIKPKNSIHEESIKSHTQYVYALRGAFIMLGALFFEYYDGFDERTFLYNEENILGEMLLVHHLKTIYVLEFRVYHKESKTIKLVFSKNWKMRHRYARESAKHWYYNYYLKNLQKTTALPEFSTANKM